MSVESLIRQKINDIGYITVDEMIRISMSDLNSSYYRSCQPLGENADFITSPEISQMFGEMIGIWAICVFERLNRPSRINLVELGPGRGLLMRDMLRATALNTEFHNALNISLCEINPLLVTEQKNNLAPYNIEISYISKISDIENDFPSIIIANEFFDALPIKQYIKLKNDWNERVIDLDKNGDFKWNHIVVIPSKEGIHKTKDVFIRDPRLRGDETDANLKHMNGPTNLFEDHINAKDGAILEESQDSRNITSEISRHLQKHKGSALIIDYGYNIMPEARKSDQYNSTLQAIKSHKFHNIFEDFGLADLSSHVDFDALQNIISSISNLDSYIISQKNFLKSLGIDMRLKDLIQKNPDLSEVLKRQHYRLTEDNQMGLLFKSLIVESF